MDGSDERSKVGRWHLAGIMLAMLLGVVIAVTATAKTFASIPSIGDIVLLRPATEVPRAFRVDLLAHRSDHTGGAPATAAADCVLEMETMAVAGGSLIVEGRGPGLQPTYLVHWAGGPTSRGADDCGTSADLEVTANVVQRLAQIAGGFGVDPMLPAPSMPFVGQQLAAE